MMKQYFISFFLFFVASCQSPSDTEMKLVSVDDKYYYLIPESTVKSIEASNKRNDSLWQLSEPLLSFLINEAKPFYKNPLWETDFELFLDKNNSDGQTCVLRIVERVKTNEKVDRSKLSSEEIEGVSHDDFRFAWVEKKIRKINWEGITGSLSVSHAEGGQGWTFHSEAGNYSFSPYPHIKPSELNPEKFRPKPSKKLSEAVKNHRYINSLVRYPIREVKEFSPKNPRYKFKDDVLDLYSEYIKKQTQQKDSIARFNKSKNTPKNVSLAEVSSYIEGKGYIIHSRKKLKDKYVFLAIPYGEEGGCLFEVSSVSGEILEKRCGSLQNASFTFDHY